MKFKLNTLIIGKADEGMPVRHFKYGICPRGHLNKYTAIRH